MCCIGDSITQRGSESDGWTTLLAHFYSRRADLLNRGYSGYNSAHVLAMMQQHIRANVWPTVHAASSDSAVRGNTLLTLFLGANDSCLPDGPAAQQAVSIEAYRSNLAAIAALLVGEEGSRAKALRAHLVIIGPPQCDARTWGLVSQQKWKLDHVPITRNNAHTKLYSAAAQSVAAEFGVPFIDLFTRTSEAQWNALLVDGLHPNAQGNRLIFDLLVETIAKSYPHIAADKLPVDSFPFGKIPGGSLEDTEKFFEQNKSAQ